MIIQNEQFFLYYSNPVKGIWFGGLLCKNNIIDCTRLAIKADSEDNLILKFNKFVKCINNAFEVIE